VSIGGSTLLSIGASAFAALPGKDGIFEFLALLVNAAVCFLEFVSGLFEFASDPSIIAEFAICVGVVADNPPLLQAKPEVHRFEEESAPFVEGHCLIAIGVMPIPEDLARQRLPVGLLLVGNIDDDIKGDADLVIFLELVDHVVDAPVGRGHLDHQETASAAFGQIEGAFFQVERTTQTDEDTNVRAVAADVGSSPVDAPVARHPDLRWFQRTSAEHIHQITAIDFVDGTHGNDIVFLGVKHVFQRQGHLFQILAPVCCNLLHKAIAEPERVFFGLPA
jgi:hypothetical protein